MVSPEISRQPLSGANRPTRAPEERLALRFPALADWLRDRTWRRFDALAPRSPVRRRLIARGVERGVSAYNRRDWPAWRLAHHPRATFHPPPALVESGAAEPVYHGPEDFQRLVGEWLEAWGEFRVEPRELIDTGDRIVLLGNIVGEGAHSRVPIGGRRAWVWQLEKGRISSQWEFDGHAEALAVAGVTK
jgi:SnoaL-like domain